MDNDDHLIGRLLSRRDVVRLLGAAGAAALVQPRVSLAGWQGTLPTACVVRPEMTEGPYFVPKALERSDIRVNTTTAAKRDGVALGMGFVVTQIAGGRCTPLADAIVDVWQCDAVGVYSGVVDPRVGSDLTDNALRGIQRTGATGAARFTTIYPGWYRGRAVHLHFKIRTQASGQAYEYTSQLFFPETLTDRIHALPPYASHGRRDTLNDRDGIYRRGGTQLLLDPQQSGGGYDAVMHIALDLSDAAVGRPDGVGQRGRGRGPGG
jgi:protocatechuate 3,4-dioxygenase beta subunit